MRTLAFVIAFMLVTSFATSLPNRASAPSSVSFDSASALPSREETFLGAEMAHAQVRQQELPLSITIPAIRLSSPIAAMGINAKGELDVPSGATNDVGWWQGGTTPGSRGSAVLDAHVYAAFKNLRNVKVGNDIYVTLGDGTKKHFVVRESLLYPYDRVPAYYLFERDDAARLNLITCAGAYDPRIGTYTKRLVVYAMLVAS